MDGATEKLERRISLPGNTGTTSSKTTPWAIFERKLRPEEWALVAPMDGAMVCELLAAPMDGASDWWLLAAPGESRHVGDRHGGVGVSSGDRTRGIGEFDRSLEFPQI